MGVELGRPLRAAVAAVVAWLVVQPLGGVADEYPFYAPLGALVAVTASVIGSARESLQTIVAMAVGVGLAVATTPLPQVLGLLVVVAVGSMVPSLPYGDRLGEASSWTAVTGLFVLVIGGDSPWDYAGAYVGLTTVGALIGLAVNALWPPLPLRAEARTLASVRDGLAHQLEAVAGSLRRDAPPAPEDWAQRVDELDRLVARMRAVASQAGEARRGNWRVRRQGGAADQRYLEARALERLAFMVEDLTDLLADQENAEREHVALGPQLRPYAARALADLALVLSSVDEAGVDEALAGRAEASVEELVGAMRRLRERTGDDLVTAGGVVTAVRRTLSALEPVRELGR